MLNCQHRVHGRSGSDRPLRTLAPDWGTLTDFLHEITLVTGNISSAFAYSELHYRHRSCADNWIHEPQYMTEIDSPSPIKFFLAKSTIDKGKRSPRFLFA
jgi:hypothetical protein